MTGTSKRLSERKDLFSRRRFIAKSAAATAGFAIVKPSAVRGFGANSRIEVGCIGLGVRGNKGGYRGGEVANLYLDGIRRNLETFHHSIVNGKYDNPTVEPSIDSTLATILGREAAAGNTKVTWDDIIVENKKIEVDLTGLRA